MTLIVADFINRCVESRTEVLFLEDEDFTPDPAA